MKDFTLQIGGSVIRSPYGVEVTWKKTLFTNDGDKTTKILSYSGRTRSLYQPCKKRKNVQECEKSSRMK